MKNLRRCAGTHFIQFPGNIKWICRTHTATKPRARDLQSTNTYFQHSPTASHRPKNCHLLLKSSIPFWTSYLNSVWRLWKRRNTGKQTVSWQASFSLLDQSQRLANAFLWSLRPIVEIFPCFCVTFCCHGRVLGLTVTHKGVGSPLRDCPGYHVVWYKC